MPSKTFYNLDEAKKNKIIEAAAAIFLEQTFENAKVVDICKKCEIPRVTFYSYFESLEDIYNYIFEYYSSRFCNLESIKSLDVNGKSSEDIDLYMNSIEYFMKIISSDVGLKKVYGGIDTLDFTDKAITHCIISLGFQYKSGAISRKEFIEKIGEVINNIQ